LEKTWGKKEWPIYFTLPLLYTLNGEIMIWGWFIDKEIGYKLEYLNS
jgi:hypothetical protein